MSSTDLSITSLWMGSTVAVFVTGPGELVEGYRHTYLARFPAHQYGTSYRHVSVRNGNPELILHRWVRPRFATAF